MTPKNTTEQTIDIVQINDYLTYFYWGRHPNDKMMDMRLGGGSFAIHQDDTAFVVDTMTRPGQGGWVREYLDKQVGIKHFTLISSHWHVDHVVDNHIYQKDVIIGHKRTREVMLEKQAVFEAGGDSDYDAFQVVPPNLVFEGRLDLWLGNIKVELHEYKVHEEGHLGVYLPDDKIFIANDILEDPIWFFDFNFASAETQTAELERLMAQDIDVILPCHGSLETIKNGGYRKQLIQDNLDYLRAMLAAADQPDFKDRSAADFIAEALDRGSLTWWEPYEEVHELNQATLLTHQK